ncbi:unnamed protein product [Nezara viridula]|uniref:Uncharacterized protein n=1 Tax=Nezara viridula TaxID=85310 RepID=A0A9P0MT94_NEZVI|nr:unnamed protein product [Nezara viridula]
MVQLLGVASLALALTAVAGTLPDLECPDDCDCHYFRINWVTDCSESNLTSVPTYEEGLSPNVYVLDLSGNQIESVETFPEDVRLRSLKLADNHLTKVTHQQFSGLKFLLDLDLSGNRITYVEPDSFKDSHGLITLELQMNPLEDVDGPFLISESLLNLDLSNCSLQKIGPTFFTDTKSLSSVDLSGNPLGSIPSGVFNPLTSLQHLKLNRCNLSYIASDAFDVLENLKVLELAHNSFTTVEWVVLFGKLPRLEFLDLRRSGIKNLPDDVFQNNTWMRSLIMAENELSDLDVATTLGQNLKHLDFLDLSNCNLVGPLSEDAFAVATNLRTLILSDNSMSANDLAVALKPLTNLQKLSLRNCSLTRLPPDTFHRFTSLQELDISRNPLNNAFTSLLRPLSTLIHLDMGYSNLAKVSKNTFSLMTSLKTLILSGNSLKSLESGLFKNLTDLKTLELNNCGLSRLNETVFQDVFYPDLEELLLAGNPLDVPQQDSIIPTQLNRLKTLDLSRCNISYLPIETFKSFGNITDLRLAGNRLMNTNNNTLAFLHYLPNLEKLDLAFNNITMVFPQTFRFNTELKTLKLVGNPWKCGCHISDMWEWAQVVKGDIGVLVGAITSSDTVMRVNPKRKNILLCHFDSRTAPVKARKWSRREFANNVNHSWARYVKESACDSGFRVMPKSLIGSAEQLTSKQKENYSSWVWATGLVASVALISVASFLATSVKNTVTKRHETSPPCSDVDEKPTTTHASQYLRRPTK